MPSGPGVRISSDLLGLEQQLALAAHGFGHDEGALDAPGGADHGQADAGVARGGLDDDGVGADFAGLLGGVEHGHGDAVLDAVARVHEFQLDHHGGRQAGGEVVELDQGGIADQFGDIVGDAGHDGLLKMNGATLA